MPQVDAGAAALVENVAVGARDDLVNRSTSPTGKGIEMTPPKQDCETRDVYVKRREPDAAVRRGD